MTHPINAAPTFQSTLQVPDDGDPAQATAPGTPPELATVEEIAQTVLDNTKALETWLASTCFPASDNNALAPATFDPRIITRMWSRPSGFADGSAIKIDDSIDWRDRDVFVLFKELGGSGCGRDEGGAHLQNSATVEQAWGYLGTGGLDAAASDPAVTGNPPIIEAGKFCVRVIPPDVRLYANADTGHLWLFNNSGAAAYVELWIFATGKTTTGDGGSASADGSTTIVGGSSLPGGTDGGVLAHVSGAWVSTGAGTAGQHLKSNGAGAPTWETPAAVPSPAGSDPEPLGSVDPGSASTYARADHVHPMPSASDIGAIEASALPIARSWIDLIRGANEALPSGEGNGNYTMGTAFFAGKSGLSCTGLRFYWVPAASRTIRCSLYSSASGSALATVDVVVSATGYFTATFSSPVALSLGVDYIVAIYELGGTKFMNTVSLTANRFPPRPTITGAIVMLPFHYLAAGAAKPTANAVATATHMIEPTIA